MYAFPLRRFADSTKTPATSNHQSRSIKSWLQPINLLYFVRIVDSFRKNQESCAQEAVLLLKRQTAALENERYASRFVAMVHQ
jgi:hypothetical protein